MNTNRTRYHVGFHEIGLDSEYRVECIGEDVAEIFAWLEGDISGVAEDVEDDAPLDELYARLAKCDTVAELVGEHTADAFVFFVRPVTDCGCPCDCDEHGEECDGEHRREAAAEPQLAETDEQGRSSFKFDRAEYVVFNTASKPLDGYWTVERVAADGSSLPMREYVLVGQQTREDAFALAVEKLRPSRHITFMPQRDRTITMSQEDQDAEEYPTVTRDGWVCAWSTAGYVVVFEDRVERGIVWPGKPIEASVAGQDGRQHDLDGTWRFYEQAAAAVRAHVLDARA
ncbi:hypothetical protein JHN63_20435 [Streptomyces sp. MBT65]|uniref:hypothetical protein n=1 Tax=unclassified Streptomyces TaxID=2593676 RepID=UPI00190A6D00|nr:MULTISPECIES: hypothetical protein [unclassified Streptomyces]MBK3576144.1 hypothetical protein [Streptomyces sp. MBT65]MBK3636920.1 hypothetical protein [Streptomyces sp. MBT97]